MRVSFIVPSYNEEVPISYDGRMYEAGKNVNWRDGFKAVHISPRIRVGA